MVRIPQRPPRRDRPHPPNLQQLPPRLPPTPLQLRIRRHRIGPTQATRPLIPQKHLVPQIPRIGPQPPLVHAIVRAKRPPPFRQNLHPTPPAKRPPMRPHLDHHPPRPPSLRQPPPRQRRRLLISRHPPILTAQSKRGSSSNQHPSKRPAFLQASRTSSSIPHVFKPPARRTRTPPPAVPRPSEGPGFSRAINQPASKMLNLAAAGRSGAEGGATKLPSSMPPPQPALTTIRTTRKGRL
jgi:hypothetical protein